MESSLQYRQARLLLMVLPHIADAEDFALKGGTAINLFLRDIPRLSVDIDLVYLPEEPREVTLDKISASLKTISKKISKAMP